MLDIKNAIVIQIVAELLDSATVSTESVSENMDVVVFNSSLCGRPSTTSDACSYTGSNNQDEVCACTV